MGSTNTQEMKITTRVVLVLLSNIQNATTNVVCSQPHSTLQTLPRYVNQANSTKHIITVYLPFFLHPQIHFSNRYT